MGFHFATILPPKDHQKTTAENRVAKWWHFGGIFKPHLPPHKLSNINDLGGLVAKVAIICNLFFLTTFFTGKEAQYA